MEKEKVLWIYVKKILCDIRDKIGDKIIGITGMMNEIIFDDSRCRLLEMEDVLFHQGSAVMMP